ncbi:MAG TPA: hypothetical protein VGI84_09355 [Pseudonocardiaceae bacterium]|jgi:hypothetical protein
MHVLVTEAIFGESDTAVAELRAMGHQVSTCHGDGGMCRAVSEGTGCPLDDSRPVDLVVDVRGFQPDLTAREFGAVCAIRAGVPVALVSTVAHQRACFPAELAHRAWSYSADQLSEACDDVLHGARATF